MSTRTRALYFILLSAIAAMLVLIVFSVNPSQDQAIEFTDKMLVGIAFVASCSLGISMTVSPNWARKIFEKSPRSRTEGRPGTNVRGYRGHHPDCTNFRSHRISTGNRDFCSGCLGLMIGGAASIALMMIYTTSVSGIDGRMQAAFLAFGFGTISIACVEAAFGRRNPVAHLIVNSLMVVGFFLLVAGMLEATGSGVFGLLVVAFSFLWMDTRIRLSQWRHSLVCDRCLDLCKMY